MAVYKTKRSFSSNNRINAKCPRVCPLEKYTVDEIDYKNHTLMSEFTSNYGRILPRRLTGICAKKQRKLRIAIIRARFLSLVSYCTKKI